MSNNKKMKIALITDYLAPYCSANSAIVYKLAESIKNEYDADLYIFGHSRKPGQIYDEVEYAKIVPMQISFRINEINSEFTSKISRIFHQLTSLDTVSLYIKQAFEKREMFYAEYSRTISEINKQGFDCIVGFSTPDMVLEILSNSNIQVPYIGFMLDPWSTLWYKPDKKINEVKERRFINKASAVFTTPLIYKEYKDDLKLSDELLKKITCYQFPNVYRHKKNELTKRNTNGASSIKCVFTGCLYQDIRNPKYVVELFKQLDKNNIVLHIYGKLISCNGNDCFDLNNYSNNIVYHGLVSNEEAMDAVMDADILINIGNTVMNLLPSKILTYISTGKPIVNFIKSPNCPTLSYMEKYPIALNILETSEIQSKDVNQVLDFILKFKGEKILFEEIETLYETCTPKYVSKQLYETICKVVDNYNK